ncbi:MAG: aminotransferase class III-fold pyridoxal phosphate-dependent enzyme [Labedaea sp.]
MTTSQKSSFDELIADLFTQQWVIDLLIELAERQHGSMALTEQMRQISAGGHVFMPFHAPQFPLAVVEASGSRLVDIDGNSYLDVHLGFGGQSLFGHNPPEVVEFVKSQLGVVNSGNGYLNPIELRLVEVLRDLVPHNEKFAFLNSGTDATNAAIRLARAHTGRRLVAKFEGCWHGVHDIAAHNTSFLVHGHPLMRPFPEIGERGVTPEVGFKGAVSDDVLVLPNDTAAALALIERHRHELACVLGEVASQSLPFTEHNVPRILEVAHKCRALGVPFVLDEVLTGFRFGAAGAAARFNIPTDLICYGKVVSGLGIGLSVVAGRAELIDGMQTTGLALADIGQKTFVQNTHSGNHLALAASYAALRKLRDEGESFYARTRAKVDSLQSRLAEFRVETSIPLRLLGFGEFCGTFGYVEKDSYADSREFAGAVNALGSALTTLLLRKRGVYTFSMPMFYTGDAHSDADIDEVYTAVTESAQELEKHGFPFVLP